MDEGAQVAGRKKRESVNLHAGEMMAAVERSLYITVLIKSQFVFRSVGPLIIKPSIWYKKHCLLRLPKKTPSMSQFVKV